MDYANRNNVLIIFDAAYEAYISEEDVPHSIYQCQGAKTCAIEIRSFSKNAGFTGMRLGFTVVPKELVCDGVSLHDMWARRHGTKFNGAPYIWMKTPDKMTSWEFFDELLTKVNVVGTPGSGFGPSGEHYFRLTAFGTHENTLAAMERIKTL